jgi:hypothetical protein
VCSHILRHENANELQRIARGAGAEIRRRADDGVDGLLWISNQFQKFIAAESRVL